MKKFEVYYESTTMQFVPPPLSPLNYKPLTSSLTPLRNLRNGGRYSSPHFYASSTISCHNNGTLDYLTKECGEKIDEYLTAAGLRAELMPKHVAVIADGNRRWARRRGWPAKFGHMTLALVYRELSRLCCNCGIKVLTAYLFSTENWKRSKEEVESMMNIFEDGIRSNLQEARRQGIRISVIGNRSKLPKSLLEVIIEAEENTKANNRFHLILAISYGGQYDILQACKGICEKVKAGLIQHVDNIDENIFEKELGTNCTEFPFPDLLIRTSENLRISNFLCYQSAYSELYFTKTLFPDFGEEEFITALKSFQKRNRRFGGDT